MHRSAGPHCCDRRCEAPHACRPLAHSSIRQIHFVLTSAYKRAQRWQWISINPIEPAEPMWGLFLFVAMTSGARRGELCSIRRADIDWDDAVLTCDASTFGTRANLRRKGTKSHQTRLLSIDETTMELLRAHVLYQDRLAQELGCEIDGNGYLFSPDPDCHSPFVPGSVTQRYGRLVKRLGITSTLHKAAALQRHRAALPASTYARSLGGSVMAAVGRQPFASMPPGSARRTSSPPTSLLQPLLFQVRR